ncbi:ABC transporter permease [Nonomuraea sp. SMC257]|uniref:ABC transporter permease n=1 Tax=Nonomuraea montanisoli TaxID=2741721 RepID=A0A7Y6IAV9_9ACTN|nr:ABC transporter permease [Nonomuraea montanisoli]NUW33564.1 ABC transporter permease [Nonomuraea montanisoli]
MNAAPAVTAIPDLPVERGVRGRTLIVVAWLTLRSRVSGFAGAVVALVLGVAFAGAATSTLASGAALPPHTPEDVRRAVAESGALLVMLAVIGVFVTVFVVAGTFAFVVAQRRGELAALRTIGATPHQVRGMVTAEAMLAAVVASTLGVLLAPVFMSVMAWVLRGRGLLPEAFEPSLSGGALAGCFAAGVTVGLVATVASARRAASVRPLEAMRAASLADQPIGRGRRLGGLAALACGGGMPALVPIAPPDGRMPLTMFVSMPLVLGFALLSPAFAAWAGALVATPLVRWTSATGELARENVRLATRRTAATAAPVLVTVGLAGSLLGGTTLLGEAMAADARQAWRSHLVVSGPGAVEAAGSLRDLAGVAAAVPVVSADVEVFANRTVRTVNAMGVDPDGVSRVIHLARVEGDLGALRSGAVAADRRQAATFGWKLGQGVELRLPDGRRTRPRLVAVFDGSPLGGGVLVSRDLLAGGARRTAVHVTLESGQPVTQARIDAVRTGIGERHPTLRVEATQKIMAVMAGARQEGMRIGTIALAGFAVAYTLVAVANTSALSFGARGAEFARLLFLGARGAQVLRMALWEALCVAATGVVLGLAVTGVSVLGLRGALGGLGLEAPAAFPWKEVGLVAGACVLVVLVSALVPTGLMLRRVTSVSESA